MSLCAGLMAVRGLTECELERVLGSRVDSRRRGAEWDAPEKRRAPPQCPCSREARLRLEPPPPPQSSDSGMTDDRATTTQSPQPQTAYSPGNWVQSIAGGLGLVVGVGDASPWLLGTNGYAYHYTNDPPSQPRTWAFDASSAGTSSLAVSPEGTPWRIDGSGYVYERACSPSCSWQPRGQNQGFKAYEVGIGRYSSSIGDNIAWAISRTGCTLVKNVPIDCPIYEWNGASWFAPGQGAARHVAVSPDGSNVYVANSSGNIYKWNGSVYASWPGYGGTRQRSQGDTLGVPIIGAGPLDSVWIIGGTSSGGGGYDIFVWTPLTAAWNKMPGEANSISVGADGTPWVINSLNQIFEYVTSWQTIGPYAGFTFGNTVAALPSQLKQYECADHTGEVVSERYSGEVHDIDAVNAALGNGRIIASATSGGAWSTPPINLSWTPMNDVGAGITAAPGPNMSTGTIAAYPGRPDVVVVGTGVAGGINNRTNVLGNGIWTTTDALDARPAWSQAVCKNLFGRVACPSPVVKVRFSADGTTIYAAGTNNLYYSTDAGANFWQVPNCNVSGNDVFTDMVIDPNSPTTVYLGIGNTNPAAGAQAEGVSRITGATTGTPTCSTSRAYPAFSGGSLVATAIALAITRSSVVYAAVAGLSCTAGTCVGTDPNSPNNTGQDFQGIFSTNSGQHPWLQWGVVALADGQQPFAGSQGNHDFALGTNPDGSVVLLGGVQIWRGAGCDQATGCSSFCWETDTPHEDEHAMTWGADGLVYAGSDGGIFFSPDDGVTWHQEIDTLGVSNEVSVSVGPTVFYGAAWDVGGHYSTDDGITWLGDPAVSGVDGHQVLVDPGSQANAFYCGDLSSGSAPRFANVGGGGWTFISEDVGATSEPCEMAKAASGNLFTVFQNGIFQSSDYGQTFSSYSDLLPAAPAGLLVTNDFPSPTVYAVVSGNSTLFEAAATNQAFQATALPTSWPAGDVIPGNAGLPPSGPGVAGLDYSDGDLYIVGAGTGAPVVFTAPAASKGQTAGAWVNLTGTSGYSNEALNAISVDSATRSPILVSEGRAGNSVYRLNNPDVRDTPAVVHHWRPWVYGLPTGFQPVSAVAGQYENGVYYYYIATWGRGIWKREARGGDF